MFKTAVRDLPTQLSAEQLDCIKKLLLIDAPKLFQNIDWNAVAAFYRDEPVRMVDDKPIFQG